MMKTQFGRVLNHCPGRRFFGVSSVAQGEVAIASSVLLSRIPVVTPTLSQFEEQYYHYQDELSRRLMWTFPYYTYFKRSSLQEMRYLKSQKWPVSKQDGVFYPRGVPDVRHNRERRAKQEVDLGYQQEVEESNIASEESTVTNVAMNSRTTKADLENDLKSLERSLDKTLYLVVKDKENQWKLPSFQYPQDSLSGKSPLHEFAKQNVQDISKNDICTFSVTNKPIHVLKYKGNALSAAEQSPDIKEYITKSHILAGDFVLDSKKTSSFTDYLWLTNEELPEYLSKEYFQEIRDLLSEY